MPMIEAFLNGFMESYVIDYATVEDHLPNVVLMEPPWDDDPATDAFVEVRKRWLLANLGPELDPYRDSLESPKLWHHSHEGVFYLRNAEDAAMFRLRFPDVDATVGGS